MTPTAGAPAAPAPAAAAIRGRVWHDVCALGGGQGGAPLRPGSGCVPAEDGGFRANGVFDSGEPGLAGVTVSLSSGACPTAGQAVTRVTAGDGTYAFTGLAAGVYCVAVPVSGTANAMLLPGQWTHPPDALVRGEALLSISVGGGEERTGVDFGWDYQFLPLPP